MKAHELRIGNYYMGDDGFERILKIKSSDIEELYNDPADDFYKPILLTEEWLKKFGFITIGFDDGFKLLNHWIYPRNGNTYLHITQLHIGKWAAYIYWKGEGVDQSLPIFKDESKYYVHQLQNLFYALTSEELTYKKII